MDRSRGVVVDGWGTVADETVAQLRRVGVPVRAGAHAVDAAELEVAGGGEPPGALILVTEGRPAWQGTPSMVAPWHAAGVAHLPVVAGPGGVVVGPLVVPGTSACLACVSSAGASVATGPAAACPGERGAAVLAAAVATVTVLATLRGDRSVAGISTEIGPGGTTVTHRVWASRSGCRCASVRMAG